MMWAIYALLSAFIIAIIGIIEKNVLKKEHATQFALINALLTAIITAPILFNYDLGIISWKIWILMYISSLTFAIGFLFFVKSVRHAEISRVHPLLNLTPLFVLVLSFFLLSERISFQNILGILVLSGGTLYLIKLKNQSIFTSIKSLLHEKTAILMVISLLFYSVTAIIDKAIIGIDYFNAPPLLYLAILQIFVFINLFVYSTIEYKGYKDIVVGMKQYSFVLVVVAILFVATRLLYFQALTDGPASLVSGIRRSSVLLSTTLGIVLFHEHNYKQRIISCLIMLVGAILIIL